MAEFQSSNYVKSVAKPQIPIEMGEVSGKPRFLYNEYQPLANLAAADTILLGKIPAGARVIGGWIKSAAQGGSCTADIGNQISAQSGAEVADVDSLGAAFSLVAAGALLLNSKNGAKFGNKFTEEVLIFATINATGSTGLIQIAIEYVLD